MPVLQIFTDSMIHVHAARHAEAPPATVGAQIIDGKRTSELIRQEIAVEAAAIKSKYGKVCPRSFVRWSACFARLQRDDPDCLEI